MIARYNTMSFIWGVPGILMQICGYILRMMNAQGSNAQGQIITTNLLMDNVGRLVMLIGTVLLLVGFAFYAKAKGRSPWWCLFAFLSLIGLIVLACLKDLSGEREE